MAKRASLDDRLAAVRRLRDREASAELTAELKAGIADRSNLIVAAAAAIAGDRGIMELAGPLCSAFAHFLIDPVNNDQLCRAKLAVIQTLDRLEHEDPDVFLKAARHVQMEPVWGGKVDTAAPLRSAALVALTRINAPGLLTLLVDGLVDPEKDVRISAASALGAYGSEAAGMLLRLKARIGDPEPDVLSECLGGLLTCNAAENLPLVTSFLDRDDDAVQEAALLALGRSRLPAAFEALRRFWESRPPMVLRETTLLALVMLRLPAATEFLIGLLADESETTALAALSALKVHVHDPRMRQRIADAVLQRDLPALQARFEKDFRPDGATSDPPG